MAGWRKAGSENNSSNVIPCRGHKEFSIPPSSPHHRVYPLQHSNRTLWSVTKPGAGQNQLCTLWNICHGSVCCVYATLLVFLQVRNWSKITNYSSCIDILSPCSTVFFKPFCDSSFPATLCLSPRLLLLWTEELESMDEVCDGPLPLYTSLVQGPRSAKSVTQVSDEKSWKVIQGHEKLEEEIR